MEQASTPDTTERGFLARLVAPFTNLTPRRKLTHAVLLLLTVAACYAASLYAPRGSFAFVVTIGCGYLSLALLALTLVIGPVQLLRRRSNPVNIDLRRDIGIWAGITGVLHVIAAYQIHFNGQVIFYFVQLDENRHVHLRLDNFGLSNWIGEAALILLVALLVTSNTYSLRVLRGRFWKQLQRLNYLLAVLVVIHTVLFQAISNRESPFIVLAVALTAGALALQLAGFFVYRARQRSAQRRFKTPLTRPE